MNGYLPDWEVEEDYGSFHGPQPAGQKVPMSNVCREEQELIELVWQNGHVIKQNQNHKINTVVNKYKQSGKHETLLKCEGLAANFNNLLDEEETAAWFQYPLDDTLEKDFCSEFFQGDPIGASRLEKDTGLPSVRFTELGTATDELLEGFTLKQSNKFHTMPPSRLQNVNPIPSRTNAATGIVNFSHFSRPINLSSRHSNCQMVDRSLETTHNEKQIQVSPLSSSTLSRNCGSNQTQDQRELICTLRNADFNSVVEPIKGTHIKTNNTSHMTQDRVTITSSSSVSKICPNAATHKRKERDVDESECQTEETENQSFEGGKSQRSSATRRSRAAEVHNLSERRRRDRINEKMKALQELIPHCNKTDKASMLDEAIEYLKSLQLQVQMMWMGNGMAPIMFPNAQHYLSLLGAIPPIPSAIQMSTTSCVNQSMSSTSTSKTSAQSTRSSNYLNQIQNSGIPEAFIPYLRLQNMQSLQGINMFTPHASQLMQHNCTLAPTSINTCESINPSKDDQMAS